MLKIPTRHAVNAARTGPFYQTEGVRSGRQVHQTPRELKLSTTCTFVTQKCENIIEIDQFSTQVSKEIRTFRKRRQNRRNATD